MARRHRPDPRTLTGLGILGTFVGLLLGLRNISFVTVEAALGSVQSILAGIDTAFYTSIAGVILSILFNITNNVLRNIMNRETGLFLEEFHKTVIPTTDEQARYSSRREVRQILELLDRLPKNTGSAFVRFCISALPQVELEHVGADVARALSSI